MIKARVVLDVVVDPDYGGVSLNFAKDSISFYPTQNTKVICISTEVYPNIKSITPPPSNKLGVDADESTDDPDKTDIH